VFLNQKNCAQIYTQRRSNFFIKSKLEPKVFFLKITQHWLSLEREVGQIYLTLWIIFKIKKMIYGSSFKIATYNREWICHES
jgi:hypothetical protein